MEVGRKHDCSIVDLFNRSTMLELEVDEMVVIVSRVQIIMDYDHCTDHLHLDLA